MAHEVRVARLGWSMEQGTFLRWLKRDGERVEAYEPLYELEGEKGTQEVEATDAGILRIPPDAPAPASVVPVGALLGYLLTEGEALPWEGAGTGARGAAASEPAADAGGEIAEVGDGRVAGSARPSAPPRGAGAPGAPATPCAARKTSSPRARRLAAERGIDWRLLEGSGRGGRVREADVARARAQGEGHRAV